MVFVIILFLNVTSFLHIGRLRSNEKELIAQVFSSAARVGTRWSKTIRMRLPEIYEVGIEVIKPETR